MAAIKKPIKIIGVRFRLDANNYTINIDDDENITLVLSEYRIVCVNGDVFNKAHKNSEDA